jgi:hypothetical protein
MQHTDAKRESERRGEYHDQLKIALVAWLRFADTT